jgi:hypothetical protein
MLQEEKITNIDEYIMDIYAFIVSTLIGEIYWLGSEEFH